MEPSWGLAAPAARRRAQAPPAAHEVPGSWWSKGGRVEGARCATERRRAGSRCSSRNR
ncbi:hypothetical protein A7982_13983 [Minicystis rosea]|nr:hypothetical protein A7982_13983 [Minicystis rosea]